MANYSDIKGFTVQTLSTDTIASQQAGGTWASGTALNTSRDYVAGWAEDSDACLIAGGSTNATELYNGTSWTEKNDMSAPGNPMYARHPVGTTTAALAAGGGSPYQSTVEQWDGTNWTEVGDLVTATSFGSNSPVGTTTAGLIAGGLISGGAFSAINQVWNGSSWSDQNELNEGRSYCAGLGTTTAALEIGGQPSGPTFGNKVEQWDGSSWTEISEFNTSRARGTAGGTTTSALFYAGAVGPSSTANANTEFWNGSSWTEIADLSTARMRGGGGGSLTSAILAGGDTGPGPHTTATEEWSAPAIFGKQVEGQLYFNSTTNTFKETVKDPTAGTWASSGGLNENRALSGGSGVQTAAIYFGGPEPSYGGKTETYNGSSFTEVADLNTGRVYGMPSGHGTTTATICFGGEHPIRALTESWDGSSWTEVGDLNLARYGGLGAGTATAAIAATGYATGQSPVYRTECELYDGSSWTEVNNNNTARYVGCGFGLQTTAVYAGGNVPPNNTSPAVESWDGTSWTEIAELNTARQQAGSAGATGTDGLIYGGRTSPGSGDSATTEYWNGSSWTEIADMATARGLNAQQQGMSPLASLAVNATPPSPASEEFTSAGLANKTITAS